MDTEDLISTQKFMYELFTYLVGGLEHFLFSHILGIIIQLTNIFNTFPRTIGLYRNQHRKESHGSCTEPIGQPSVRR